MNETAENNVKVVSSESIKDRVVLKQPSDFIILTEKTVPETQDELSFSTFRQVFQLQVFHYFDISSLRQLYLLTNGIHSWWVLKLFLDYKTWYQRDLALSSFVIKVIKVV